MSDVVSLWLANGGDASVFGPLTQAILATQNATQVESVGLVPSQSFLKSLVNAATSGGSA
jgi:hypothetical protein